MRTVLVCLLVVAVAGCASAPPTYEFNPVVNIEGTFDVVWASVVEYFAIGNLPIKTIEKDSGLIVSDWMDAGEPGLGKEDKTFCNCGGAGLNTQHWTRGKFSVFVKKVESGKMDLRVTCTYQQRRSFSDSYSTVNCNSTGALENQLHAYVEAKVYGTIAPQVPSFRPGQTE